MPITDKDAVLIIGAGTSMQYGMPSGEQLFEKISRQLGSDLNKCVRPINDPLYDHIVNNQSSAFFDDMPILATYSCIMNEKVGLVNKVYTELAQRLKNQTSETIDDFIAQNPDLAPYIKIAVAVTMFQSLYARKKRYGAYSLKQLDARRLVVDKQGTTERNWVHLLINLVRESIRVGKENGTVEAVSPKNKVKIISFNYDMILEHILDKQFANVSATIIPDGMKWSDYIEVVHVHGKFDGMKLDGMVEKIENPFETIKQWANSFVAVNENLGEVGDDLQNAIGQDRERAIKIVRDSRRIYATGFAFSQSNVEVLRMLGAVPSRVLRFFYTNYKDDFGLRYYMESIQKDYSDRLFKPLTVFVEEASGTPDAPMSTVNWFYSGVPGRLPS